MAYEPGTKRIKIGRTADKAKRKAAALNHGRTEKITEFEYFSCKDTLKAAKDIHAELGSDMKSGDWFSESPEHLREIIKKVVKETDKNFDPTKRHRGGVRNDITLITESGYFMLVKSFTDDLAWKVQRQLVQSYFRKPKPVKPITTIELIELQTKAIKEVAAKVEAVDKDLQEFKKDMPLLGLECQKIARAKNRKVVPLMGGKDAPAYKDNSLRGKVYRDIDNQLRREFDVDTYKAIKRNQVDTAVSVIEGYQLPMALEERINLVNGQISFV